MIELLTPFINKYNPKTIELTLQESDRETVYWILERYRHEKDDAEILAVNGELLIGATKITFKYA